MPPNTKYNFSSQMTGGAAAARHSLAAARILDGWSHDMVTDMFSDFAWQEGDKNAEKDKKRILTPLISPQKFGIDASKDKADTPVVARVAGGDCNQ